MYLTTLFFADWAIEHGVDQCDWCGEWFLQEALRWVQVDVRAHWVWVCGECLEAYDRAHC